MKYEITPFAYSIVIYDGRHKGSGLAEWGNGKMRENPYLIVEDYEQRDYILVMVKYVVSVLPVNNFE